MSKVQQLTRHILQMIPGWVDVHQGSIVREVIERGAISFFDDDQQEQLPSPKVDERQQFKATFVNKKGDEDTTEKREYITAESNGIDLLYCRIHGQTHHSDCEECHRYIHARIELKERLRRAVLSAPSTAELVEMLKGREGIITSKLCGSLRYEVSVSAKGTLTPEEIFKCLPVPANLEGPATILVVREDVGQAC